MTLARIITLDPRFNGPPGSANGGYACGMAAAAVTDGPAEVALRRPPPLGVALEVVVTDAGGELRHDGQTVAVASAWDGQLDVPPAVPAATVAQAAAAFDVDAYAAAHPFDRCFTCGPARSDGLGLYPAPVPGTRTVVWPWTPAADTGAADGLVAEPILWAALDCPTGLAWMNAPDGPTTGPAVLARLAVCIDRRPAIGERLLVEGWQEEADGRKRHAAGAMRTPDGEVLAASKATWVVLDADQAAAFAAG